MINRICDRDIFANNYYNSLAFKLINKNKKKLFYIVFIY